MNQEVKKILEDKFDYDFDSEIFTDEVLTIIDETIQATTLQLLQTDVIKSVCIHCNKEKEVKRIDGSYWCKDCRKGW